MKLIKLKTVMDCTGLARSTVYKFIAEGRFPKPVKLGARMVAWVDVEVLDWMEDKVQRGTRLSFKSITCH